MPTIEKVVELPARPEQVWAVVADPSRFGEWLTMHKSWQGDVPVAFGKGTRATAVVSLLNMPSTITWTVAEYEPHRSVRLTGVALAGVEVSIGLDAEPSGTGTRITVVAAFDGQLVTGPIGAAVENAARTELDGSAERLAALVS